MNTEQRKDIIKAVTKEFPCDGECSFLEPRSFGFTTQPNHEYPSLSHGIGYMYSPGNFIESLDVLRNRCQFDKNGDPLPIEEIETKQTEPAKPKSTWTYDTECSTCGKKFKVTDETDQPRKVEDVTPLLVPMDVTGSPVKIIR